MQSKKRVLIIAAHPDDDILGCGGFISRYSKEIDFRVIFIAEGSSCRYPYKDIGTKTVKEIISQRNSCGVNALGVLGVTDFKFYDLPCGRLDQVPIIEINKIIESEMIEFKPDSILTHNDKDANNDHQIVFKSTMMATRPGAKYMVNNLYSYEVLSSSEWKFTEAFKPNLYYSISEQDINNKWKALREYETEINEFPYPRSKDGLITLAKYRGMQSNNNFAEAFRIIRMIRK